MIVGLGIDCEEICRWEGLSDASRTDPRFALFTELEHRYCSSNAHSAQHYAGRWCLKEATVKALTGFVAITTRDVEVEHIPNENPRVMVPSKANVLSEISFMASVTHSELTAVAVVIALARNGNGGLPFRAVA